MYKNIDHDSASFKYLHLNAQSRFKGQSDLKKFEKARRLGEVIEMIRGDYTQKMSGGGLRNQQIGTAIYLIDKLALRVGNEKNEDEADTVGCCSLRVEHVEINAGCHVTLAFLGKDSMRYCNKIKVIPQAFKNLQKFKSGKRPNQPLFCQIDAGALNTYLKRFMPGLSAKVFRTYNASRT
jgi:DNA topoisomerase-1